MWTVLSFRFNYTFWWVLTFQYWGRLLFVQVLSFYQRYWQIFFLILFFERVITFYGCCTYDRLWFRTHLAVLRVRVENHLLGREELLIYFHWRDLSSCWLIGDFRHFWIVFSFNDLGVFFCWELVGDDAVGVWWIDGRCLGSSGFIIRGLGVRWQEWGRLLVTWIFIYL